MTAVILAVLPDWTWPTTSPRHENWRGVDVSHDTVRFWWHRFRRMRSLQKFASVHASVTDHFNNERSLASRPRFKANRAAAFVQWRDLCAA